MRALPVLDYVIDSPATASSPVPSAVQAFVDPQGVMIANYRVFLSARIEHGATLLILADEDFPRLNLARECITKSR